MRQLLCLIIFSCFLNSNLFAQKIRSNSIEKTFQLGSFTFENGYTIPNAYIKYATYGKLNKERNNVIVLPSSFGADYTSYAFLMGQNKAIDTNKWFVILPELFANGRSSSPSNTPYPFDGPRFPQISINDNVIAQYKLIHEFLNISSIKAVIGFSMGAQQAFQWALNYPSFVQSIVPFCGTAKTYPHGYLRLESAIATIETDENFKEGDYKYPPMKGLKAWSLHWASWFLSQEWYRKEKYKELGAKSLIDFLFMRINADSKADANDRIAQALTWQQFDISKNEKFKGNIEKALSSIHAKILYMPSTTDLYFPIEEAAYEKAFLKHITFQPIPSIWGHLAGAGINPDDNKFINRHIHSFLTKN